jgi:MSHA biogenesis protein MshP
MSHKLFHLKKLPKQQQGFLLPLAIFIVVVMGVFALVLSRNTIQAGTSSVQEAVSTQAFYAAESGAQRGMQVLFLDKTQALTRQAVDSRCTALNTTYADNVPGLKNCSAAVKCTCKYQDAFSTCSPTTSTNYTSTAPVNNLTSFYTITSTATCGTGTLKAERTIEAGSFLKQE